MTVNDRPTSPRWSPLTKQIVIIVSLAGMVWLIHRFGQIINPLIVAMILAYFLNIPVRWLVRRTGWPRTAVVVIIYLLFLFLLASAPALVVPWFVDLVRSLGITLAEMIQDIGQRLGQPFQLFPGVQVELSALFDQIVGALQALLSPFATSAVTIVFGVASSLLWLLFVLVVSFWLVKDNALIARYLADHIPPMYREELLRLAHELVSIWDAFVRGQLTVGLIVGTALIIVLSVIGMPNAVAFGMLAAVMELIPSIGSTTVGALAVLVALFRGSSLLPLSNFWFAVLVAGVFVAVFQLDGIFIAPRIVGRRVHLHPMVVFVGIIAGARVAGALGMLLASPTIASLRVIIGYIVAKLLDEEPFEPLPSPPDLPVKWRGLLYGRPVEALLFDLDGTLVETDDEIVHVWATRIAPLKRVIPALEPEHAVRWWLSRLEGPINTVIACLDRWSMDERALGWAERLARVLGYPSPEAFVPVPGAVEALRHLQEHYRIGIVTTRRLQEVRQFVRQNGLDGCVGVIVARDNYPHVKPHPGPILHAAEGVGVDVEHCVVVGDSPVDITAARAAGALAVAVLSGFGRREDFNHADLVVDSVFDLLEWL
ncbi:MAG: AI-2E family transporter [Anaerolineae bacterium]|nr:AI-2E family transporter [Anaerolineae bacterium]